MKLSLQNNVNSLSYFKNNFNEILKDLEGKESPFVITQNGKPAGVFLNIETWEALLRKTQIMKAITEAEDSIKTDGVHDIEDVEAFFKKKYDF